MCDGKDDCGDNSDETIGCNGWWIFNIRSDRQFAKMIGDDWVFEIKLLWSFYI